MKGLQLLMNTILLGYLFGITSSIFSAIYVIPKKLSNQKPIVYALIMGGGYFSASVIGYIILRISGFIAEPLFLPFFPTVLSCLNGVLWLVASVSVLISIDKIGLAKSNQWKSLQGPVGAFLILTLLSEFLAVKLVYLFLAIILITLAAIMFSTRETDNKKTDKAGIIYAFIAAIFFGIYAFIKKILTDEGILFTQQIYTAIFVVISAAIFYLLKNRKVKFDILKSKREIILPLMGGFLFFINASFNILSYNFIEGSIASMLHQLNAVWLLLLGVFVFKEIDYKKHWVRLAVGLVFSVIGVVMLLLARM